MNKLYQPCYILQVHFIGAFDDASPCYLLITKDIACLRGDVEGKVSLQLLVVKLRRIMFLQYFQQLFLLDVENTLDLLNSQ
jgi:hypothetical protein